MGYLFMKYKVFVQGNDLIPQTVQWYQGIEEGLPVLNDICLILAKFKLQMINKLKLNFVR